MKLNSPTKLFTKKPTKKSYSLFRPMILSRHPSHSILRSHKKTLKCLPYQSVIRFGSTTEVPDTIAKGGKRIEINTVQAIKNSANKFLMKNYFSAGGVKTAPWFIFTNQGFQSLGLETDIDEEYLNIENLPYPIVAKNHYGSGGKGNTLIKSQEELSAWMLGKTMSNYIFEKFINYALEYRLHITKDGCFYTCRKALKKDCPDDQKWRHHDDTCVWFLEDNENFMKPNSWKDIINDCVNALKEIGADILSFDVKVQSSKDSENKNREYQNYILLECNSASSMNNDTDEISVCAQKYINILPILIIEKGNGR